MVESGSPRILGQLPRFPDRGRASAWNGLRIEGLVAQPLALTHRALMDLPQEKSVQDFRCEEGWTVPTQEWEGVPMRVLLEKASPLEGARFVVCSAGSFTVGLTLEEALGSNALLALRLNGYPLPPEHGGPCRLVVSKKSCYFSIKWLDRLEVTTTQPRETGRDIALGRMATRRVTKS